MSVEVFRRSYFDAAYRLLSTEGYGGVKLRPLCSSIQVTTGGFYHWFGSWQEFTDALLEDWRRRRTSGVDDVAASVEDPVERLELLAASTMRLDQRAEAAIRTWGQVDLRIGAVVAEVDAARFTVVHDAMAALVGPGPAERFAEWGYGVLLGYEQLARQIEAPDLTWALGQVLATAQRRADDSAVHAPAGGEDVRVRDVRRRSSR